jgi:hypothetical protein
MVAERKPGRPAKDESGQSIIEFLILLPLMVGIVVLMIRVNTTIQISIVNQQYARAHTHWLTFNSPIYPEIKYRKRPYNQMIIGVSSNTNPADDEFEYQPEVNVQKIARDSRKGIQSPKEDPREVTERTDVRVRTSVALCTQSNAMDSGGGVMSKLNLDGVKNAQVFAYCQPPEGTQ